MVVYATSHVFQVDVKERSPPRLQVVGDEAIVETVHVTDVERQAEERMVEAPVQVAYSAIVSMNIRLWLESEANSVCLAWSRTRRHSSVSRSMARPSDRQQDGHRTRTRRRQRQVVGQIDRAEQEVTADARSRGFIQQCGRVLDPGSSRNRAPSR